MNIPEGWKLVRSEPYGTLFNCEKGHSLFVGEKEQIPAACSYCSLAAAPTPPAQDEPAALPTDEQLEDVLMPLMRKHLSAKGLQQTTYASWKDGIDIDRVSTGMMVLAKELLAIYTRPQSDKLRKAAEEALKFLSEAEKMNKLGDYIKGMCVTRDNLRAALEGE